MLWHSVVQFRESNQAEQSSEQSSKHAAPYAHTLILQPLAAAGHQRSRLEAQTQHILPAGWFIEVTDLDGCPLQLHVCWPGLRVCVCLALLAWFSKITALFIWLYLSATKGQLQHTLYLRGTNQINWKKKKAEKKHWVKSANRILGCVCSFVTNIGAHAALLWKTQMAHDRQQVKKE